MRRGKLIEKFEVCDINGVEIAVPIRLTHDGFVAINADYSIDDKSKNLFELRELIRSKVTKSIGMDWQEARLVECSCDTDDERRVTFDLDFERRVEIATKEGVTFCKNAYSFRGEMQKLDEDQVALAVTPETTREMDATIEACRELIVSLEVLFGTTGIRSTMKELASGKKLLPMLLRMEKKVAVAGKPKKNRKR